MPCSGLHSRVMKSSFAHFFLRGRKKNSGALSFVAGTYCNSNYEKRRAVEATLVWWIDTRKPNSQAGIYILILESQSVSHGLCELWVKLACAHDQKENPQCRDQHAKRHTSIPRIKCWRPVGGNAVFC